jgi:lipoprotein-anchoring transpeptidase ErfK/SrfK
MKKYLFIAAGVFVALGVFQFTLNRFTNNNLSVGCHPSSFTGLVDPSETVAFWENRPVTPLTVLADTLNSKQKKVLGATTSDKWIEVDLGKQKITAHQGDDIFLESLVSTGLFNRTPVGEYHIWYKIRATKMEGGNKALNTYYYLPNVPYTMFFVNDFGIHGTYWHNNFGNPMSHGCVNTPTPVAEKLFYWVDPQLPEGQLAVVANPKNSGTRVVIHQ